MKPTQKQVISTRNLKDMDMNEFRNRIKNIVENVISSDSGFESSYNEFKGSAESLLDELAPITTRNVHRKTGPKWVDEEFKKARAERRKLEKSWRKSKMEEDNQLYVTQRNICAQLSISKQQRFFSNIVDASSNKQKSLFKVVDEVLDKKAERVLPAHDDPYTLPNEFNQYLSLIHI